MQTALFFRTVDRELIAAFIIAVAGSFGLFEFLRARLNRLFTMDNAMARIFAYSFHTVSVIFYAMILVTCSLYLVAGSYNPFIYYRF